MDISYINLTTDTLPTQHLCCAIADPKHQCGVQAKKDWLAGRLSEGHVFRKLDAKGKVFIEYAPLETAWTPILGENYLYIYCFWVSGKYKQQGHGKALLSYCIADARQQGKSGVCVLCGKKKKPFLSDGIFMKAFGFTVCDTVEDYELLALSFDGTLPRFADTARRQAIDTPELTIYYSMQCPYIPNCLAQTEQYCAQHSIPLTTVCVDSLAKAKAVPCVFNNWAVFYQGKFQTVHLLNTGYLQKLLSR